MKVESNRAGLCAKDCRTASYIIQIYGKYGNFSSKNSNTGLKINRFVVSLREIDAKMRFFLYLSYNGTAYNGWQIQPNAPSVQQTIQDALTVLLKEKTEITGAGRTDTGVHAAYYVAHMDTDNPAPLECENFCYHLNCILPRDIAVSCIKQVKEDAHARFDAVSREYKYYITRRKDPFSINTALMHTAPLNIAAMNEAAKILFEYDDFTSFSKLHSDNKTNICKIMESAWEENGDILIYTVRADRFLRNMVRAIVGTLLDVGRGKIATDDVKNIIELKFRGAAGASVPPHGLFLTDIEYNENI